MRAQRLDRTLRSFRIGDPDGEYPVFSAKGSALFPGRWHIVDHPLIYTSEHVSTAMLEILVRGRDYAPRNQHYVEVEIDAGLSYEVFLEPANPGWDARDPAVSQAFGARWAQERRSLALLAPSVVARMERNVLINPAHPEFAQVRAGLHRTVWWDDRLFGPAERPTRPAFTRRRR